MQLSSTLNLMVLAEYVETEEQKEVLHGIGCDCYQGNLYSPAVFLNESKKMIFADRICKKARFPRFAGAGLFFDGSFRSFHRNIFTGFIDL